MDRPIKNQYIRIRLSDRDRELIEKGATEKQMTMTEYILYLVRKDADK